MKLEQLVQNLKGFQWSGDRALDIRDVTCHTDAVKPGSCFVAIRGFRTDGHRFVEEAIRKGASLVVLEEERKVPKGVAKMVVEDSRDALARLAASLFGEPTKQFRLVGITGTNGKTTTAGLLEAIWKAGGATCGVVSTVAYRWGGHREEAVRTTPEASDLQRMFHRMTQESVADCVMEVTSHAIELKRVVGCHFDGLIFTNLTQDHLDFHKTMENYFAAKEKLFREHLSVSEKKNLWAVLNWDDPCGRKLGKDLPAKVWRFSLRQETCPVRLLEADLGMEGSSLRIQTPKGELRVSSPLIGMFNAQNILAAAAAGMAMDIPLEQIEAGIAGFEGMGGRLERFSRNGVTVFVDYAHTPNALQSVLAALKNICRKKLITVFGCGGNRDREKRPKMGMIAEKWSDRVIMTSDNPRDEDPEAILDEIEKGFAGRDKVARIADRREAIEEALRRALPGDCVLIAGKGHEAYQEIRGVRYPFDDRKVTEEILNAL